MTFSMKVNSDNIKIQINDSGVYFNYISTIKGNTHEIIDFITKFFSRKIYNFIFPNLCRKGNYYYKIDFECNRIYEFEYNSKCEYPTNIIRGEKLWKN